LPRTLISRWAAELRAALVLFVVPAVIGAQDPSPAGPYASAVATWISLIASPGYERAATDRILAATTGWTRDRAGNLIKRVGDGTPRHVVACGIDESGYVVSSITDDGYLRVHMNGNGRHPALWDQYHEGQRVIVQAVDRASPIRTKHIAGVFAVKSNHLWRRRALDETPTSIENLWIDIGARSRAEAERMGVDVLNPVVRDWPEWTFADWVAGPAAGNRAACAAVAAAGESNNRASTGETVFIISVRKSFSWAGLTSALARLGQVDGLVIVDTEVGGGAGSEDREIPIVSQMGIYEYTRYVTRLLIADQLKEKLTRLSGGKKSRTPVDNDQRETLLREWLQLRVAIVRKFSKRMRPSRESFGCSQRVRFLFQSSNDFSR